jgi:hypothetical protein
MFEFLFTPRISSLYPTRFVPTMLVPIGLRGPRRESFLNMKWDTAASLTVVRAHIAELIGINLGRAREVKLLTAGGDRLTTRLATVNLRLFDGGGHEAIWTSEIGFVTGRLENDLCGHFGIREFFLCEEREDLAGQKHSFSLTPTQNFLGQLRRNR